ncbi:AAA family ATPase [Microbacterium sp. 4R-513]|uniref:AAA family ATPase n=1 Tax=Microbacterium sp. 4R-513 TaxID=2567934 RepID=UPI0013E1FE51|nr:adenylate/guanylate cyclase domain-containing protein [Microbacterium sp. 4R-513]QIG39262.1 AAA family ATPase [Microbacterium sp. 4R-513]
MKPGDADHTTNAVITRQNPPWRRLPIREILLTIRRRVPASPRTAGCWRPRRRGLSLNAHVAASALSPRLFHGLADDTDGMVRVEGTAVVVDISGFTTLSEQLAAAGREGTEQLIATLSRIFTVLLPATDDGGDVVKFAGDALFVLFSGPDHARHAAHAAWNMNRVLTAIGDIHLPAAHARLRMSVGVHSGSFDFFVTGGDNVSVILTGADTSRVIELQSAAEAGRILVSDETAALLPATQVGKDESADGARRLLKAGSVVSTSLMALSAGRTEAAERFLPRAFARRPDLLGAEPDHRWAAIAFVQVSGVPDGPGTDDLAQMDRLTRFVEEVAEQTGVTLLDVDPAVGGYRYFLTAGAPTTAEDPEGRLVSAALRIVHDSSAGYALRAGVTSGRVFAGFVGATYRQTYTVMGDPTNLAARLASRADSGTVLVARSALERTGRPFDAEDGGTIAVKGKTQQIPVAVVTGHGGATTLAEQQTPFVGRHEHLERLRTMLTDASAEVGSVLTITGPAGIGKTRLLEYALEETPLPVLRAYGDRYGASTPYRALQTLLRPLLRIRPAARPAEAGERLAQVVADHFPHLTPWLPLIAPAVAAQAARTDESESLDDSFRAERTAQVVSQFLAALTSGPGCLVLDDAQWVDPASAAVLTALIERDTRHAVLIVRRPGESGVEPLGEDLVLGGLEGEHIREIIEAVAGRRLLPADARPLIARAEGNPLYAIELATSVASGDDALGIEQLIGERIDALTESERTTLRRAAVLGIRIPLGLYVKCVGMPLITGGLGSFLEVGGDGVSFRSELFRDVAYDQLTFQSRRELHRAAAAALEADPALGGSSRNVMLATHYEAAGDWEAAHRAAIAAAKAAEEAFALEEAVRNYRLAVEAARRSAGEEDLPTLLEALGRVSVAGGWAKEGLEAFSAARKLLIDAIGRARVDRERAYALNILGRQDEAVRTLRTARRALTGAGAAGHRVLAAIAVTEAGLRLRQSRWADARGLANEAIGLLDGNVHDDTAKRVLADALRYHDIAASELEGDAGMIHLSRALELYDETNDELSKGKVLSLLGVRAYYRGDWTTAAALYEQARAAHEAAGDVVGSALESANASEILIDQGRIDEARPLVAEALRVFEATDNPYLISFMKSFSGRIAQQAGDTDGAISAFRAAAQGFGSLGETDETLDSRVRLLEATLDAGDGASAREMAAALSEARGPRLLRQRARLAALDGDDAGALALTLEAVDDTSATPLERALSLAQLGRLRPEASVRSEAERLFAGLGVVNTAAILGGPSTPTQAEHAR